jgi:hypothetical protein
MAGLRKKTHLSLLESGNFSDFTITCGDVKFQVHRNIICPESPVLTAACNGNFKVKSEHQKLFSATSLVSFRKLTRFVFCSWQEAADAQMDFPEERPSILGRVLLFLYTSEYDDSKLPDFFEKW